GRNSRLYLDLVHNRQVASDVTVAVTPFELASVFDLAVTLNPGQPAPVASESIDRVVAEFLEKGPTAEEVERAVAGINARTVRALEELGGFSGKATVLAEGELYAGDPLFIEKYLGWINAATPEEVRAAAQRWLARG